MFNPYTYNKNSCAHGFADISNFQKHMKIYPKLIFEITQKLTQN
jgi:hypothetical protein